MGRLSTQKDCLAQCPCIFDIHRRAFWEAGILGFDRGLTTLNSVSRNVRYWRRSQRVDATPAANLSSGDLTPKIFLGRSLSFQATLLRCVRECINNSPPSESAVCVGTWCSYWTRAVSFLTVRASVSRQTLDYLFDSYTKNPLLPFELRCCVDRLSRQPKADIRLAAPRALADVTLWMLEDAPNGGMFHVTPK